MSLRTVSNQEFVVIACFILLLFTSAKSEAQTAEKPNTIKPSAWRRLPVQKVVGVEPPIDWKLVVDAETQLQVSMPTDPTVESKLQEGLPVRAYTCQTSFGGYVLMIFDTRKRGADVSIMLAGVESGLLQEATATFGDVSIAPVARFRVSEYEGREVLLQCGSYRFYNRYFCARSGVAISLGVIARSPIDYDLQAKPFLDSFAKQRTRQPKRV